MARSGFTPKGGASARFGKNYLINGNFDFWQRGLSLNTFDNSYRADRWRVDNTQANTHSRQTAGAPEGSVNYWRTTFAASGAMQMFQAIESGVLDPIKGKVCTVSFLIRTSGTFSGNIQVRVQRNATADTSTGGTWTNITTLDVAPTASWVRHSLTFTIPDDGSANGLRVNFTTANTQSAGNIVEFAQVILNEGDFASSFRLFREDAPSELFACQRYYEKSYDIDVTPGTPTSSSSVIQAAINASSQARFTAEFKAPKRVATYTFTAYSPDTGVANRVRDLNAAVDRVQIADSLGERSAYLSADGATANQVARAHWVADAEL
ncbi:MAG: hypothetical protein A4S09_16360 [Proteobacteria bacterium SG_bin7]|nr:MAG: hypothetical protein A4S09_16360 [Proteobacteria bacterium SG_bin7]